MNWIKENKFASLVVSLLVGALIYSYANKDTATLKGNQHLPQVGGADWNRPYAKNLALEAAYHNASQLPPNHTVCFPVKKFYCDGNSCERVDPTVFNLLGGNSSSPIISRCDSKGCDTYNATIGISGEYKNIQSGEPKGYVFKMSYNTVDQKFVEIATLGLDAHVSYGYCVRNK